jgi:hypothetical protein
MSGLPINSVKKSEFDRFCVQIIDAQLSLLYMKCVGQLPGG